MPVQSCETEGRPGFRWGESGVCYGYEPGDEAGREAAREKAERQGRAVKARQNQQAEEGAPTYAMVALIPTPEVAEALAVEGGEAPEILHITLVYLGPEATVELDRAAVEEAVRRTAEPFGPISGVFNGMCRFGPEGEGRVPDQAGQTPLVTTFDGPGLGALREAIRAELRASVDYPEDTHDFLPHCTLLYATPNAASDLGGRGGEGFGEGDSSRRVSDTSRESFPTETATEDRGQEHLRHAGGVGGGKRSDPTKARRPSSLPGPEVHSARPSDPSGETGPRTASRPAPNDVLGSPIALRTSQRQGVGDLRSLSAGGGGTIPTTPSGEGEGLPGIIPRQGNPAEGSTEASLNAGIQGKGGSAPARTTTAEVVVTSGGIVLPPPSMLETTFAEICVCWGDYLADPANLTRIPLGAFVIEEEEAMAARKVRTDGRAGRTARATLQAEGEMPDPDPSNGEWEACLIIEGRRTDDSRIPGGITWREPPLALMWTDETSDEHGGAKRVGTIADVWQEGDCWRARGVYIGGEEAAEFKARVARGEAGWPSADIFDVVSVIEEDEEGFAVERMVSGTAAGATIVPMQAQEGTWIRPLVPAISAAGGPFNPPAEWFEDPGLEELTPLTVTDEGRVYGHFAGTDCHNGLPGCVRVPEDVDYEVFNSSGGVVTSAEGTEVPVGPVTLRGGHAPLFDASGRPVDYEAAKAHYDESDAVIAYVRAGPSKRRFDGRVVPWVAGVLRPGVSDEQVHTFRALGVSGDWRPWRGRLSLNAVLSVPRPGFPVPRVLVASGHVEALITYSPETEEKEEEMDKETFAALHAEAHAEERKSRLAASHPKAGEAFAAFQQGNVQALIDFYCGEAGIPWGSEGEMTACMEIAEGNVDDPAALCNWMSQQCGGRFASGGPNGQVQELLLNELDRRVGKEA